MGSLTGEVPFDLKRTFKVKDKEFAEKLLQELENQSENKGVFDDVVGIWANRQESSDELTKSLRKKSNNRNAG
jgi:hypothetical protein